MADLSFCPLSPFPYRRCMLRVMTVRVEAEAMAETGFTPDLIFGRIFDEFNEAVVRLIQLAHDFYERKMLFSF